MSGPEKDPEDKHGEYKDGESIAPPAETPPGLIRQYCFGAVHAHGPIPSF